ncbi:MAG: hypothetical protein CXR31_00055 [Geobacter sp.]|nr:MAG: hypothetical protein CXR31_00055 [Geobacter sp.]
MKIRINLFFISSIIITLAVLFSTLIFLAQIRAEALQRAAVEQERAIRTFWQLLLDKGGDVRVVDGRMMAGGYLINGNHELPDKVRDIFGGTATIFMGDTRIATNVLKGDASRAVGTRLTGPAYDAIFGENRSYRGEAPIFGIPYFTAYDPIRNGNGKTIGALYVGIKKDQFLAGYSRLKTRIIVGTAVLEVLLVLLAWGLLRERVRADTQIREIAKRIRLITDSVPVGIAYVDTQMCYLFANRRYEKLFEIADGESLVGRPVGAVVGDAFFASREEHIRRALAGNEVVFIHTLTRSDGDELVLQTAYIPHVEETGTVVGYFIQHYDITDLTMAQEALRTSEEQYRTLFNTTGTAMFVSEEDTTVSLVNEEFSKLSGYRREEIEGRLSWTIFVTPESRERMLGYHRDRRIDPASAPYKYECETISRDGSLHNILAHVSLIPGTNRSVISFLDITGHKQMEANLQSQLTFLQTLIDTIPSPIFYKDRDGRYTGCNLAFENYIGLARDEVVGKTVYDMAPTELADRYREMDEDLFGNPGVQIYDASVVYADGNRHEVTFNKATFANEDGQVEGLVGVILDVSEQKRAAQLLAGEKLALEMIVQEAPLADVLELLCRNVESHSPGALCSVMLLDASSRRLRHVVAPSLPEEYAKSVNGTRIGPAAGSCGTAAFTNRPVVTGDIATDPLWEKCRTLPLSYGLRASWSMPIRSTKGASIGTIAVYFPAPHEPDPAELHLLERAAHLASIVIERSRGEEALRESEERFHQIFVQNGDAILLVRMDDFDLIDANPAALELFGYDRAEMLALKPYQLIFKEDFDALVVAIPRSNPAEVFQLDSAHGTRRDGAPIIISIRCKILRLREEYVIYCSIRDITDKVRLEEEVRDTHAKLIHTNKMTSLGMLASSVAHEINNPNNCISVNAAMMADVWHDAEPFLERVRAEQGDFLLRGIPFSKMREFAPRLLNGIAEGSRRITSIVHNMRDFVRKDKSGLQGEIDVNRLIQTAATILWHHIHMHTNNFQLELEETLPKARGNAQQIEQVIINLVVNALQSLPDKEAGVSVSTSHDNEAGTIIITIKDEGKGMDKTVMARLKDPFFTTKQAEGGTGLGLYISDSILKEHKGVLEYDSSPGRGTTATVTLPMADGSAIVAPSC